MERAALVAPPELRSLDAIHLSCACRCRSRCRPPPELRSLDAIHLATALDLADDLDGFVSYDERLARAADDYGIPTLAPR